MYTLNDFFCGCGGIGLGFKKAGFKIVGAWDFDKYVVKTYRENVGDHVVQADISKMTIADIPKADVWAFGFPCQDLSVAGKQAGMEMTCLVCGTTWKIDTDNALCPSCGSNRFKSISRSGLFFEIMRLLDAADDENRPYMLMAENVKALRPLLPVLEAEYAKRGYRTYCTMYNSKYWYVPQNRERYFVVGVRNDLKGDFLFPAEQHDYIPKLSSVLETNVDEKYYISDDKAKVIIDQALKKLESLGDCHATITPDRIEKRQNGRRSKEDEAPMFTLTAQDLHGVIVDDTFGYDGKPRVYEEVSPTIRQSRHGIKVIEGCPKVKEVEDNGAPKIMKTAHRGNRRQKGYIHCTEGIVGACIATDYKEPKYILEIKEGDNN